MSLTEKEMYEFGPFSLDPAERIISRHGTPLPLTPKVFDTLVCLVRNRGRLLTKDELLKEVWPGTFVEEVNLAVNISTLRKTLGESPQDPRYIATVQGRGYRFVADVRQISVRDEAKPNAALQISQPSTHSSLDGHDIKRGRANTNGTGALLAKLRYGLGTQVVAKSVHSSCSLLAACTRRRILAVSKKQAGRA